MPLADFAEPPVESLVQHLLDLGIPAGQLPAVDLNVEDIDRARSQLSANKALARVYAAYPGLVEDPDVTVIALTDRDMFIEGLTYNWVFGMRSSKGTVISTARMYQEFWGGSRDDQIRDSRLRKMLLRYVGLLHLRLPENDSPLTVLYRHLDGLTELDAMREGILEPSQLPQPSTGLAQWASGFCSASEQFAVREYRADVEFSREFSTDLPVPDARAAADSYLRSMRDASEVYLSELHAVRARSSLDDQALLLEFHARLEDLVQASIDELDRARGDMGALQSTAAMTGRLVELYVALNDPAIIGTVYDSYLALGLDAGVAISEAGPCGHFTPGVFFDQPWT